MAGTQFRLTFTLLIVSFGWWQHQTCAQTVDANKPVYEEQLAIWPEEDYDELISAIPFDEDVVHFQPVAAPPATTTTTTTTTRRPVQHWFTAPTTTTRRPVHHWITTPTTPQPVPVPQTAEANVHILHSAHVQHANGTTEDKLLLSNGVVDYKRTYHKLVAGQLVPVQEGYSAIPVRGQRGKYHTQFYVADENGNRAYRVTYGGRRPQMQHYWNYKAQKQTSKVQPNKPRSK